MMNMRKIVAATVLLASVYAPSGYANEAVNAPTLPRHVEVNGVEFMLVPQGWFWYYVETTDAEREKHGSPFFREAKVWLDDYYVAKYEARASDFARFMNSGVSRHKDQYRSGETGGCSVRLDKDKGTYFQVNEVADLPATHLSWELAVEFAEWMGFRIPTEAEWEKAARGTDKRLWPWGNEYPDDTYAGYWADTECSPTPVTAFPKGVSPYGIYNMAGNVFEFVADWYNQNFDALIQDGARSPRLATQGMRQADEPVARKHIKGGRWASGAGALTVYARSSDMPHVGFRCYGARFALDASTVMAHVKAGTAKVIE